MKKIFIFFAATFAIFLFLPFDSVSAQIGAHCGNYMYEPGSPYYEECERPLFGDFPQGCSSVTCQALPGWECDGGCTPICGDGLRLGGEVCDDGANNGQPNGFVIPPTLAGSYTTPTYILDVKVSGNYAYTAVYTYGLIIVDISNPASPTPTKIVNTPDLARGVFVSGSYAYIADSASGLQIIDITDPANATIIGVVNTPGSAEKVYVSGNYAYVADNTSGLQVIDISDPTNPSIVGNYNTPGTAFDVYVSGNYAYIADYTYGLQIINISNPTNPSFVANIDTPSYARGVVVQDNLAYVADYYSGLQIIKISDPANPSIVGNYNTPGTARSVVLSGDYAYVSDGTYGLQIISRFPPFASKTSYNTPGSSYGLALSGDYAYIADSNSLVIVKVKLSGQPNYCNSTCSGTNPSVCDNGFVEQGEICDDGPYNGIACTPAYGSSCSYCTNSCTKSTIIGGECGNGIVEVPFETCEDISATGDCPYGETSCTICNSSCQTVAGNVAYCGDGTINGPETCDDGNTVTELCPWSYNEVTCTVCNSSCQSVPGVTQYCGNGNVEPPLENCDDGNQVTEWCPYGEETYCSVCGAGCYTTTGMLQYCGDGMIESPETCDDGNSVTESCAYGQMSCTVCGSSCQNVAGAISYCGDGTTNGPETCDDGNTTTESCTYGQTSCTVCDSTCQNAAGAIFYCGDNTVQSGVGNICAGGSNQGSTCLTNSQCPGGLCMPIEACDDGNSTDNGTCNSICTAPTYCGDGTVQTPNGAGNTETCDDGNTSDGDSCNSDCTAPTCGDGFVNPGEECDGNGSGIGGETATCDADCTLVVCGDSLINTTAGEECEPPNSGNCNSSCTISICGNGYVESGEECDGNGSGIGGETETCDLDCTFAICGDDTINTTAGEECDPPGGGCNDVCLYPICGNNYVDVGEDCDVWSSTTHSDTISCNADCSTIACNDGYLNDYEVCDDSAPDPYAGATCSSITGGEFPSGTLSCNSCNSVNINNCYNCGDGKIDGPEICDDGNTISGDGCESTCLAVTPAWECNTNPGFDGSGTPAESLCNPLCGNGNPSDPGETCDDGNNVTETIADCPYGSVCTFCNAECSEILNFTAPYCGDGNVDIGEEICDLGSGQNNDTDCSYGQISCTVCVSDCSIEQAGITSYCGDGIFDRANEECDYDGGPGCSDTCEVEEGYTCWLTNPSDPTSSYCEFSCGNSSSTDPSVDVQNFAPYNEECDAGADNGLRCTPDTYGFNCVWCTNSCQLRTVTGDYCGDGEINSPYETCDQGNTVSGDGCSSSCQIETGWTCTGTRSSTCSPVSGDGICIGAPYETCTNNFNDCGSCSIASILTALPGQSVSAINSVLNAISNIFPAPQPRINIPGLNLNNARVDEPLEIEVKIDQSLFGAQSKTPFSIGDNQFNMTINHYNNDPDSPLIDIIIE